MARKLQNTKKTSKSYWSLWKIFLNYKKIPLIPVLFNSNRFISDFRQKPELFNDIVTNQYSLISYYSKLPANLNHVTDRRLSAVIFSAGDIGKIFQKLNANKAHGHDNISIRMLKICGGTIHKP